MQQFLLQNTKTFLSLLAKIEEGVVIHKEDTSIIYSNPSAAMILGLSEDELLGKSAINHEWYFINENHEPLRHEHYPVNLLFQTNENISDMVIGIYSSKKSLKWVDVSGSITLNENNERIALIIFSDVTSRKNAFEEAKLFKNLVETVDTGITISNPNLDDNPIVYANKAFSKITGYSLDEAMNKNCRFLQANDTKQPEVALMRSAVLEKKACEMIVKNYKKDGTLFYNLLNITPYFQHERLAYFVGVQHDVTKQVEQEHKLEEQSLYIQSILDAQENIVLVSDETKTTYANRMLLDFFNFATIESFLQENFCICSRFLEEEDTFYFANLSKKQTWINLLLELPQEKRIVAIRDSLGEKKYFKIQIKSIANDLNVITLIDVTASLLKELLLKNKAYHDALTGAYNRQYFYEFIVGTLLKEHHSTGIIILDIDNFKAVNDTYGHNVGDIVLQRLVTTLKKSLRSDDNLIRWGGEEFVVICKTNSKQEVAIIAEHLREAVEQIEIKDVSRFSASFGTSNLQKNENIDAAIQRADSALYLAKERGKNRVEMA